MSDTLVLQLIGWLYLALGAGILLNHNPYKKLLEAYTTSRPMLFVSGIAGFVIGFIMVARHNTFGLSWQNTLVTLISWIILMKSAMILVFPGTVGWLSQKMNYLRHLTAVGALLSLAGFIFLWIGY